MMFVLHKSKTEDQCVTSLFVDAQVAGQANPWRESVCHSGGQLKSRGLTSLSRCFVVFCTRADLAVPSCSICSQSPPPIFFLFWGGGEGWGLRGRLWGCPCSAFMIYTQGLSMCLYFINVCFWVSYFLCVQTRSMLAVVFSMRWSAQQLLLNMAFSGLMAMVFASLLFHLGGCQAVDSVPAGIWYAQYCVLWILNRLFCRENEFGIVNIFAHPSLDEAMLIVIDSERSSVRVDTNPEMMLSYFFYSPRTSQIATQ
jgi:hypothetical protein